jgi:hypothetical protein
MTESGAFVVDADADTAAERAEVELPDEDVRQIALTINLLPPSRAPEPTMATVQLDWGCCDAIYRRDCDSLHLDRHSLRLA